VGTVKLLLNPEYTEMPVSAKKNNLIILERGTITEFEDTSYLKSKLNGTFNCLN
jgi:hypothetical protein